MLLLYIWVGIRSEENQNKNSLTLPSIDKREVSFGKIVLTRVDLSTEASNTIKSVKEFAMKAVRMEESFWYWNSFREYLK